MKPVLLSAAPTFFIDLLLLAARRFDLPLSAGAVSGRCALRLRTSSHGEVLWYVALSGVGAGGPEKQTASKKIAR